MKVRIIAGTLDGGVLTLYPEDGSDSIELKQGDVRIRKILDEHSASWIAGFATEVDLGEKLNVYKDYEQTSGITKLFRVAKRFVKHLFGEDEEKTTYGHRPQTKTTDPVPTQEEEKIGHAVDEILSKATPVTDERFEVPTGDDNADTVIAVVETEGETTIIPGVEQLHGQVVHAVQNGNAKGMDNFLRRCATVKRKHTVQELLNFMRKGDLPIADDGSIIAYKVLRSYGPGKPDVFVDCHSGKVEQKVGSFVCQSESIIDQSRTMCSTGLHVARRGYLGGFNGDIITLIKINPEDVVAVPPNEPDKMRVSGYHILGKIPSSEHHALRSNQAMRSDSTAGQLLASALSGKHIQVLERVEITAPRGGSFKVTPMIGKSQAKGLLADAKAETRRAEPVAPIQDTMLNPETANLSDKPVDPTQVAAKVAETKGLSRNEQARSFYENGRWADLKALKTKAKVSYTVLGFSPKELVVITDALAGSPPVVQSKAPEPKAEPKKEEPIRVAGKIAQPTHPEHVNGMHQLYRDKKWDELWAKKQKAKKPFSSFGFNSDQIAQIEAHKPVAAPKTDPEPKSKPPVKTEKIEPTNEAEAFLEGPVKTKPKQKPMSKETMKAVKEAETIQVPTPQERVKQMEGNRQEKARKLYDSAAAGNKADWGALWLHKKQSKQSWKQLGLNEKEAARCETNKSEWV